MSSKRSNIYIRKASQEGQEILCPINAVSDSQTPTKDDSEECVEKGVVGRYAGNIEIQSASVTKNI
ncbi:MAG: hypothetical protein PVI06_06945 [Desulfobacterales bacterium]